MNLIVTEMAVIEVVKEGLLLQEIAPDTTVEAVKKATGGRAHRARTEDHGGLGAPRARGPGPSVAAANAELTGPRLFSTL